MTTYVRLSKGAPTNHIQSRLVKQTGPLVTPLTYCGLRVVSHCVLVETDEEPENVCKVCRRRSEAV